MSETEFNDGGHSEGLRMVFFSVEGVRFGADIAQIVAMVDVPATAEAYRLCSLSEICFGNGASAAYCAPKGLLLKGSVKPALLVVDAPSDIMAIDLESIRELPLLVRSVCTLPIWGVAIVDDAINLLLDLDGIVRSEDQCSRKWDVSTSLS